MTLGLSAGVATQLPSRLTRNNTEQYIPVSCEKEKGKEIQTFFPSMWARRGIAQCCIDPLDLVKKGLRPFFSYLQSCWEFTGGVDKQYPPRYTEQQTKHRSNST